MASRDIVWYGAMAFPLAFAGLPIYLHAPDFYAVSVGLPLTGLGTALLLLRLFDALQDPLIGSLSDRFHAHRAYILALGTVLLGGGFWMLFHPFETLPLLWFAGSVLICTTGFSIVSINLQALGGLWPASPTDRTRITAIREALGLAGLLTAAISPTVLSQAVGARSAFHLLTVAYLPLLALAYWVLIAWTRRTPLPRPRSLTPAGKQTWLGLLKHPWRGGFYVLVFFNTFASSIPAVLVLFFVRDRLGAESYTGLFLLLYFLAGAASMPLWTQLAARLGKLRAWQFSLVTAIVTFCWAALLGQGDIAAYAAVCVLSGMALGADLALPPAMLADHIDKEKCQNAASRLFALMALLSKSALAIATGVALPFLDLFGYVPDTPISPDQALILSLTYAAIPCILKLAALAGMIFFEKKLAAEKPTA